MKRDYKLEFKQLYTGKAGVPQTVQVPSMQFLMVDGVGDPNTSHDYMDAIQTLYPVAYAIKFACKKELDADFTVMPLESLWWTLGGEGFNAEDKDQWHWTAMIMLPDVVTPEIYERAVQSAAAKRAPSALAKLRLERYDEGRAAQVLYVGPYADEGPTIDALHAYIRTQGGELAAANRHHHEIYLGDPRRTAPAKLKTIIRQPF